MILTESVLLAPNQALFKDYPGLLKDHQLLLTLSEMYTITIQLLDLYYAEATILAKAYKEIFPLQK